MSRVVVLIFNLFQRVSIVQSQNQLYAASTSKMIKENVNEPQPLCMVPNLLTVIGVDHLLEVLEMVVVIDCDTQTTSIFAKGFYI